MKRLLLLVVLVYSVNLSPASCFESQMVPITLSGSGIDMSKKAFFIGDDLSFNSQGENSAFNVMKALLNQESVKTQFGSALSENLADYLHKQYTSDKYKILNNHGFIIMQARPSKANKATSMAINNFSNITSSGGTTELMKDGKPVMEDDEPVYTLSGQGGAPILLVMPWAKKGANFEADTTALANYYCNLSSSAAAFVAPVGMAWKQVYEDNNGLFAKLYAADDINPSVLGSYLYGLVLYASITGETPQDIIWAPKGITANERSYLQCVAAMVVGVSASPKCVFEG